MTFDIRSMYLTLDDNVLNHIRLRIEHVLNRFAHYIRRGRIVLSDVNGPKGGADKRCVVQLRLRGAPDIIIEETGVDLLSVIGRVTDRLDVAVVRAVERPRCSRRFEHRGRLALEEARGAEG